MDDVSLDDLWGMSYAEYVQILKGKYGSVPYDYYCNDTCTTKHQKNSRTKDGLVIHHIAENEHILLAERRIAVQLPFEYQKADMLVYCNMIEHLILHIKIAEEREDKRSGVGIGGCKLILQQINAWIEHGCPSGWRGNLYDAIKDDLDDGYCYMIKSQLSLYHRVILHLFDLIWTDRVYSDPNETLFVHPLELAYTYLPAEVSFKIQMLITYQKNNEVSISLDETDIMCAEGPFCDFNIYGVDGDCICYHNCIYPNSLFVKKAPYGFGSVWSIHDPDARREHDNELYPDLHFGYKLDE